MADCGRSWRLWFMTFLFLFSGCAETHRRLALTPPPSVPFEELKQRVSRIRGLALQQEISLETKEIEEISSLLEKSFLEEPASENFLQGYRVYERLGLLPQGTDLPKVFEELRRFTRGASYDPRREKIYLQQGRPRAGAALLRSPWSLTDETITQLLLVHALVHALQEQNFHWQRRLKDRGTLDGSLALRAVSKGDALLVGLSHLTGQPGKEKLIEGIKTLQGLEVEIDKELSRFPQLLRRTETCQNLQGSQFVLWAYSLMSWEGVNNLFLSPPLSTHQILHPEKYYAKREDPLRIVPWTLLREFSGRRIFDETVGELLTQILLGRFLSDKEATHSSAGWRGDTLLAFQERDGLVLGWVTAWENRESAREFYGSYQRALERRYGVVFQKASAPDTLVAASERGPLLLLQIKDDLVFFLDGVAPPKSVEIAEHLWKELETGTEVIRAPLDLAERTRRSYLTK